MENKPRIIATPWPVSEQPLEIVWLAQVLGPYGKILNAAVYQDVNGYPGARLKDLGIDRNGRVILPSDLLPIHEDGVQLVPMPNKAPTDSPTQTGTR